MAAAGGGHRRRSKAKHRLLFVEENRMLDGRPCLTYLVFKINLKDMFASAAGDGEDGTSDDEEEDWAAEGMRSFPRPVARFDTIPGRPERLDLAVVVSGAGAAAANIVAVSSDRRTVIYDAGAGAEVPCGRELRYSMTNGTTLIPLGRQVYAVATNLWPPSRYSPGDRAPSFQALQPPAAAAHRSSWSWRSLPAPPRELYRAGSAREMPTCHLTGFLAAGARVWVSAPDRGTFSFDTARLAWRKEGDWELPFQGRGLVVPDLQGLCFGICRSRQCLCAFDAPAAGAGAGRPPAARYVWRDESSCHREVGDRGFRLRGPSSLAYLGDGKFCIAWTIGIEFAEREGGMVASRLALFLMAVQVVRCSPPETAAAAAGSGGGSGRVEELRLVKHKVRCYRMSSSAEGGYVLQPSLG